MPWACSIHGMGDSQRADNVRKVFHSHNGDSAETVPLKMKAGMQGLGTKFFGKTEEKLFDGADAKEWKQWAVNQTVEISPILGASQAPDIRS